MLIATGTGYAPFRAFAQERAFCLKNGIPSPLGKCILFFGCRNREEDYIYSEEIFDHNSSGVYTAIFEAFSREDVGGDDLASYEGLRTEYSRAQRRYDSKAAL